MLPSTVLHDFDALPPVAQEQVIDFIEGRDQVKSQKSFVDILIAMPKVGQDGDFSREQDKSTLEIKSCRP
jgi:hypothetical protein